MRTVQSWLDEYSESHHNSMNKSLHWICVPLILLSLIGLLWSIPVPRACAQISPLLNWGVGFMLAALLYYYIFAWRLAIGMTVVGIVTIVIVNAASQLPMHLWLLSVVVFVLAWIGQFIGHKIEGRKPSLFKDIQFLLIGTLWLLVFIYRRLSLAY